jgi:hypothetical protein
MSRILQDVALVILEQLGLALISIGHAFGTFQRALLLVAKKLLVKMGYD